MDIAVLMTVYNRREATLRCLSFLFANVIPGFELEVFLVDDGCTDGTRDAIRDSFPQVTIIESEGNLFWNRGMYLAWSTALTCDPDYYLWLNDDSFLYENEPMEVFERARTKRRCRVILCS